MKKQLIFIGLFLFLGVWAAQAQPRKEMKGMGKERIQEAKKEFLTERLVLSEEQAKNFWPLYEAFEAEIDENREKMKKLKMGFAVKSDEQLAQDIEQFFSLREQETAIERKYYKQFQKVISVRQIAVLYQSEEQFKRWLFEKLRDRMEPPRDRGE